MKTEGIGWSRVSTMTEFNSAYCKISGLTFQTALTTCLAMETAATNVHDLSHVAESSNVHRLQTNTKNYEGDNAKTACYRCGRKHSVLV